MTIIFDGTQGITTPTETANNSVTTPVVKSGSALTLQTNGSTTAVTIDTSQNVGIGTVSPQMRVDVSGGVRVQSITNPTSGSGMELAYDGTQGIIQAYSNRTTLASVPVYLVTGQLRFPPTQNPSGDANTLDDYEEGTWTPTWSSGTATYGSRAARYTKVGNVVYFNCKIESTNVTGMTSVWINGLPFAASSSDAQGYSTGSTFCVVGFENLGSAGIAPQVAPGGTRIELYIVSQSSGANYTSLDASHINESSTVNLTVTGFYFV